MLNTSKTNNVNLSAFYLIVLLCALLGCQTSIERTTIEATVEAENLLTSRYGAELQDVVTNFHLQWSSIEAFRDPAIRTYLASDQFLRVYEQINPNPTEWLITKAITINHLRVVQYDLDYTKLLACLTSERERITREGELLETYPPLEQCAIYVFKQENGEWKLLASFDTTHPDYVARDWDLASKWVKEIIGELPRDPSMLTEKTADHEQH